MEELVGWAEGTREPTNSRRLALEHIEEMARIVFLMKGSLLGEEWAQLQTTVSNTGA